MRAIAICWGLTLLQILGIGLFLRGFLLARVELPDASACHCLPGRPCQDEAAFRRRGTDVPLLHAENVTASLESDVFRHHPRPSACWRPRTYDRFVLLIIDAWRFDFARDRMPRLARRVAGCNRTNAAGVTYRTCALLRAIADPPTVTQQRIKALTAGSLPTFIDASQNFASPVIREDTWLHSAAELGRRLVFMGDDTWMSLFPRAHTHEHTHTSADAHAASAGRERQLSFWYKAYPLPSFNVRDLHSVDDGVIRHLFPLLAHTQTSPSASPGNASDQDAGWDGIVGHFLGVDHVGHRFGPTHPGMAEKLDQMDLVLERVLDAVTDDRTLVVVCGDHGMTTDGNHGGASDAETHAALFVHAPQGLLQDAHELQRIQQIDIIPMLTLGVGLPIPFGSLGTYPRLLRLQSGGGVSSDERSDASAAVLNAAQVLHFMETYSRSTPWASTDGDIAQLRADWSHVQQAWAACTSSAPSTAQQLCSTSAELSRSFTALIGMRCRELWTRFQPSLMLTGVLLGFTALIVHVLWVLLQMYKLDPTPLTAEFAVSAAPFVVVLVLRLWALFTNSFVIAEDAVAAFLLKTAVLSLALLATRARARSASTGHAWQSLLLGVAAVACVRATELYGGGWLASLHPAFKELASSRAEGTTVRETLPWPTEAVAGAGFLTMLHTIAPMALWALQSGAAAARFRLREITAGVSNIIVVMAVLRYWFAMGHDAAAPQSVVTRLYIPRVAMFYGLLSLVASVGIKKPALRAEAPLLARVWAHLCALDVVAALLLVSLHMGPYAPACLYVLHLFTSILVALLQDVAPLMGSAGAAFASHVTMLLLHMHTFASTGHSAQFSALHYSAAFVGFDDFHPLRSGLQLAVATLGATVTWHTLMLPRVLNTCVMHSGSGPDGGSHRTQLLSMAMLMQVCAHSAAALASAAFAYIAREHLMTWAIFAPKAVFEIATFLCICACAAVRSVRDITCPGGDR